LVNRGFKENYTIWTEHGEINNTHEEKGFGDDVYYNANEVDGDDHVGDNDDSLGHIEPSVGLC
jgi:hypothetical protein